MLLPLCMYIPCIYVGLKACLWTIHGLHCSKLGSMLCADNPQIVPHGEYSTYHIITLSFSYIQCHVFVPCYRPYVLFSKTLTAPWNNALHSAITRVITMAGAVAVVTVCSLGSCTCLFIVSLYAHVYVRDGFKTGSPF